MLPHGLAHFPGVGQVIDADFTFQTGIRPSVARLTIVPQPGLIPQIGPLTLSFGGRMLTLLDCKIERGSFERNGQGEVWRLSIVDRRWKWQFGQISGTFNAWGEDFRLAPAGGEGLDSQRTPQQLAALCFEALGETQFEVSELPNDARPRVHWQDAAPAEALQELCQQLGCRVVLGLNNRASIRRLNVGAALSTAGALAASATLDPPDLPDTLAVACGPSRYQVDFHLEAVGIEATGAAAGSLLPIEQLSYMPAGGWSTVDLPLCNQVDSRYRSLARRSVLRYYRIQTPVTLPGYDAADGQAVEDLALILPIESRQLTSVQQTGRPLRLPAVVFGVWYPLRDSVKNSTASLQPLPEGAGEPDAKVHASICTTPFRLDAAQGLLIFDEPVYRNSHPSALGGSGFEVTPAPAQLVLRTACQVRDRQSLALARYARSRGTGAPLGAGTRWLRHPELILAHRPVYAPNYSLIGVETNALALDAMADWYLDAAALGYHTGAAAVVHYAGLVPIELDGAIRQVRFQIGRHGTITSALRGSDGPMPSFELAEAVNPIRLSAKPATGSRSRPDIAMPLQSSSAGAPARKENA